MNPTLLEDSSRGPRARHPAPSDRPAAAIREVCRAVGDFIEYWGFKAIHGRIWTLLAVRAEAMTQVEVAEFLEVSRSLVSGAMGDLMDHGLVEPLNHHRNTPYRAVTDMWPSISDVLRKREWMLIESSRLALESAIDELELSPAVCASAYDLERLRFLLRMTELSQAFLRLLIGIRVPRKLEGLGAWLRNSSRFLQGLRDL